MRHVVLSGAIATGPRRMVHPTAAAGLVAPPGRALGVAPRRLCTALCAVNLAAITVAADENLSLAARAQKQPASRRRRQQRTWTRSAMTGILPRHACSARCGARRRSETWPLRSAPCRPRQSGRFLPRAKQVAQAAILRARLSLWICGQRQEALPTSPQAQKQQQTIRIWKSVASGQRPGPTHGSTLTTSSAIYPRVLTAVHNDGTKQSLLEAP